MRELDEKRGDDQGHGRTIAVWILALVCAMASIVVGALAGGKSYVIVSVIVVLCAIVPFFVGFERRRPQARELVMLAVMCALAVAARAAFIWLPSFKPMAAIVMIAGIAFGPSSGFLVGSLSALTSNFIFGQGPWTPWQMLAFGLCGLAFGALARRGVVKREDLGVTGSLVLAILGAVFVVIVVGPVLDTSSLFFMVSRITPEVIVAVYLAGFPMNCAQAAATFVTLLLAAAPLLDKLSRVRRKYGMLE